MTTPLCKIAREGLLEGKVPLACLFACDHNCVGIDGAADLIWQSIAAFGRPDQDPPPCGADLSAFEVVQ